MLVNGISTAHQSDVADDDVVMTDCDSVKPAVSAENIKSAANELFKACKYSESILLYSQAIGKCIDLLSYYCHLWILLRFICIDLIKLAGG
ncbi:hypothetical protein QVD99_001991 [Batrachochytrium dendrobatidis]|nr:hypothetical protein O5D80_000633 [Batrachochytrium dendrobatidis]KAK5672188.1 hypothetical protein QVD99_001991 [Batrachochytrium dendrobatidis]